MPQTVDGHSIVPGMKVWVVSNTGQNYTYVASSRIVEKSNEFKIWYDKPDAQGYVGCRIQDYVFFDKTKAEKVAEAKNNG